MHSQHGRRNLSQYGRTSLTRRGLTTSTLAAAVLSVAFLTAQLTPACAQSPSASPAKLAREGYTLTKNAAEDIESRLKSQPDDLAARTRLLGFYFRGATQVYPREVAIEARRRHILWLIENHPDSEVSALSEATIDAKGHALADPDGYRQASAMWTEQALRHSADVRVLSHAARFVVLSDKERAASLLRQAQSAEPNSREWPARIGYVYALGILGVDMVNQNGLPTSHSAAEANSAFALRAIEDLRSSSDATAVGVAGKILGQYGLMLSATYRGPDQFAVDHVALSEAFLNRAQELEPNNPQWSGDLERLRKLRSTAGQPN
jgi:hypothetical protein